MKKINIALITSMLLLFGHIAVAQTLDEICEEGKGISTDPQNPINLEAPNSNHWRLNDFDWKIQNPQTIQQEEYYKYWVEEDDQDNIQNPFTGPTDVEYSDYIPAASASDYWPEDGWELMKVDFGKNKIGNENGRYPKLPHMMLYNKYTGTLRFFGALKNPSADYDVVEVLLTIPEYSPGAGRDNESDYQENLNATNMLSIQGESIQPLDQATTENTMSVFVDYANNDGLFFWFDIPLAYDPCVCQFKSQFDIDFRYLAEAEIELTGDITGKIETLTDPTDPNKNKALKTFSRVLAAGVSTATAIKTGGAVINVKAYKELVDVLADNATDPNTKASLETLSTAIGCGGQQLADILAGNFGKWEGDFGSLSEKEQIKRVAKGKKVIESSTKFFSSVEKGCNSNGASKSDMVISGRVNASGTITTSRPTGGDKIHMAIPGSSWDIDLPETQGLLSQTYNNVVPAYPMYNERVGTFAMLKTPELSVNAVALDQCFTRTQLPVEMDFNNPEILDRLTITTQLTYSMKITNDLLYAINPVMNLNSAETKIQARIVATKDASHFTTGSLIQNATGCQNLNPKSNPLNITATDQLGSYAWSSPFMDIDYIKSLPLRFSWGLTTTRDIPRLLATDDHPSFANHFGVNHNIQALEDNIYIQFNVVANSLDYGSDGKPIKVIQVLTFPVNIIETVLDPNGNEVSGNHIQSTMDFSSDQTFSNSGSLIFEGPVFISAKLATSNNATMKIYSLNGFILEDGAEISPDIELIIGTPLAKDEQPEATYAQVSSFCDKDNTEYKANEFSEPARRAMAEEAERYREQERIEELERRKQRSLNLVLFPNPTKENFTIKFDYTLEDVTVIVTDINGKQVSTKYFSGTQDKVFIDARDLEAGVYFIDIRTAEGKIGRERLVKY